MPECPWLYPRPVHNFLPRWRPKLTREKIYCACMTNALFSTVEHGKLGRAADDRSRSTRVITPSATQKAIVLASGATHKVIGEWRRTELETLAPSRPLFCSVKVR